MPKRRVLTGLFTAAATIALVAGCTSSAPPKAAPTSAPADLVPLAKAEGGLTLYGDANLASLQKWTAGFTAKYGIPVTIDRDSSGPLYQKFSQEEAAGQHQADVLSIVDKASLDQAVTNRWLAKYTPKGAADLPAQLGRAGYYYPVQNAYSHAVVYNPTKVTADELAEIQKDPMRAAEDPRFKGRLGVCPPDSAQLAAAVWYLYTDGQAKADVGWKGMAKIAANQPKIVPSLPLVQAVVQGEIDFALIAADSLLASYVVSGAPVQFAYFRPTVSDSFGVGVVAQAPHPNAARLFMDWASSAEADTLYSQVTQTAPVNSKAKDSRSFLNASWFKEPSDDTWYTFAKDKTFLKAISADGGYLAKWDRVFGYSQ